MNKSFVILLCSMLVALLSAWPAEARYFELDSEPYIKLGTPAISKTRLDENGAQLFEVRFNNESFTGDLIARGVDAFGSVSEDTFDSDGLISTDNSLWRASRVLRNVQPSSRKIFTTEASGATRPFLWTSLSTETKLKLDPEADTGSNTNALLDWLRGDSSDEGTLFRSRTVKWVGGTEFHNKMGSVVNSSPAYVGPPSEFFTDNDYSTFRLAKRNRVPMVYVGANDGMLHAFEAGEAGVSGSNPGREVFAYVPHSTLDTLNEHADDSESVQKFSVDGSPVVQDAYGPFPKCGGGSCWRTILVSGLRGGGRGVFALDVTDPVAEASNTSEAQSLFLWEFKALDINGDGVIDSRDNGGNAELGYTYSRPIIAKLSDGTWVAIFGNGYNSTGSGNPSLYVVDLASGSLIKRIEASRPTQWKDFAPNGLSSVTGWDADFDGAIDYVYAGDLDGNMWKFELTGTTKTSTTNMKVAFSGTPLIQVVNTDPDPDGFTVFIPITNAPVVTLHPDGGQLVYFGNGVALDATHESVVGERGIFAIRDDKPDGDTYKAPYGIYPRDAFRLTIHEVGNGGNNGVLRGIKSTTESTHNVGWVIKLPDNEQALTQMSVSSKRLNVMTVESIIDVNNFNWLHTVDYLTGAAPATPVFDANLDDEINASDVIDITGGPSGVVPIGGAVGKAVASAPLIVTSSNDNDVFILTLAIEVRNDFNSPFSDPGLEGGHIDVDEYYNPSYKFPVGGASASDPKIAGDDSDSGDVPLAKGGKGGKGGGGTQGRSMWGLGKHTHEYDDEYDTNGVQMLFNKSQKQADPLYPPHVETATGMGPKYQGLYSGAFTGVYKDSSGKNIELTDRVVISITNPHSVDTQHWADERKAAGVSDGEIAEAATFYFGCSTLPANKNYLSNVSFGVLGDLLGVSGGISAPDFAELPEADRTCKIGDLTELRVKFNDINAIRAAEPSCAKDKNVLGPVLPPTELLSPGQKQNTQYRNGGLTVSAALASTGETLWDVVVYEHLKDFTPKGEDKDRGIECDAVNEDLRAYRDIPDSDGDDKGNDSDTGDGEGGGGSGDPIEIEFPGQGGFQGFIGTPSITLDPYTGRSDDTTDFLSTRPPSRRVNWREAKD